MITKKEWRLTSPSEDVEKSGGDGRGVAAVQSGAGSLSTTCIPLRGEPPENPERQASQVSRFHRDMARGLLPEPSLACVQGQSKLPQA